MYSNIKSILGLTSENTPSNIDEILSQFISMYSNALCLEIDEESVPLSLQFIVTEAVIARYKRRGSEGLKSERVDIVSQQFEADFFLAYRPYIEAYKAKDNKKTRVRFL